jgi:hypothetical protein
MVNASTSASNVPSMNSRLSTLCHRQEAPSEYDHGEREHQRADGVQHEQRAEHPTDAMEDEVEVDPAHRQQEQGAERPPSQQ